MIGFSRRDRSPRRRTRDAQSTRRKSRRNLLVEPLEQRLLLAGDVQFRFELTDRAEAPISSLQVNDEFLLSVFVEDIRDAGPEGVAQAYLDITFDAGLAAVDGTVVHGTDYNFDTSPPGGTVTTTGLLDDVGGRDTDFVAPANPGDEFLLFRVPLVATAAGTLTLTPDLPDSVGRDLNLFGQNTAVAVEDVMFTGDLSIQVETTTLGFATSASVAGEAAGTHAVNIVLAVPDGGTLSEALSADIAVLAGSTALDPDDYTLSANSVTFPVGAADGATQTITLTLVNDTDVEGGETIRLQLQNVSGGGGDAEISEANHVVTVADDDSPVGISIDDTFTLEGNSGTSTAVFTVSLDQPTANTVTVDFATADDIAEDENGDNDYLATSGTITFLPGGSLTATISVTVNGDINVEPDETFLVNLTNATNATIQDSSGTATIENDDRGVSINDVTLAEGDSGTTDFVFTLTLSSAADVNVRVDVAVADGSATVASGDYLDPGTQTVTFTPGQTTKTVTVQVNGDTAVEGDETFLVNLSNPVNTNLDKSQGLGTITEDDSATVGFALQTSSADENAGTHTVDIVLNIPDSGSLQEPVSVNVVALGTSTATNTADYSGLPQTVTFPAGSTNGAIQTVSITVVDDPNVETDETIELELQGLVSGSTGVALGASDHTTTINDNDIASVAYELATSSTSEAGPAGTINLVLLIADNGVLEVPFATTSTIGGGSTATLTDDYTISQLIDVTFAAGAADGALQAITLTPVEDLLVEGDETVELQLSGPLDDLGGRLQIGTLDNHLATIQDNDTATVRFAPTSSSVAETAGTHTVPVVLDIPGGGQLASPVTVDISELGTSTAANPADYGLAPTSVTFPAGSTNGAVQNLTLTLVDDQLAEGDELVDLQLSNLNDSSGQVSLSDIDHQVTITDDDNVTQGTVGFAAATSTVGEAGGTHTVNVVLSLPQGETLSEDLTVDVKLPVVVDGAVSPDDFALQTTSVTFLAGNGSQTIPVQLTIVDDGIVETDEPLDLLLDNLNGGNGEVSLGLADHTATIEDNDSAEISIDDISLQEGNSGTVNAVFTLSISAPVSRNVTVDFTTRDGTATTSDNDYQATSGTAHFVANGPLTNSTAVSVPIVGDQVPEPDELLQVLLSNALFGGVADASRITIADNTGEATIENDDRVITVSSVTVAEGDSGTADVTVTVTLSDAADSAVTVDLGTVDGTALGTDSDYQPFSGNQVTIPAGQTSVEVTFPGLITGDNRVEEDESFFLQLSNPVGALLDPDPNNQRGEVLIQNDDNATLSVDSITLPEGDSGLTSFDFTATLSQPVDSEVSVTINVADIVDGDAEADLQPISDLQLTFAPGVTTQTFSVMVIGETLVENDEIFTAALSNLVVVGTRSVTLGADGQGTIENDDSTTVSVRPVELTEGTSATDTDAAIVIELSSAAGGDVTVTLVTSDGSATAGEDYVAVTTQDVVIPAGQTSVTVTTTVTADNIVEGDETFIATISNPRVDGSTNEQVTLGTADATVTITNDDAATVEVVSTTATELNSGTSEVTVTVRLTAPVDTVVSVTASTADDLAEDENGDGDYQAASETLIFLPGGSLEQTFTFLINGDEIVELDETVLIVLSNLAIGPLPQGGEGEGGMMRNVMLGATGQVVIQNDDAATIAIDDVTLAEGDAGTSQLQFSVTLSHAVDTDVTVDFTTQDLLAQDQSGDGDYQSQTGTLTFTANSTQPQTISIDVNGDEIVELDETLQVVLSNLLAGQRNVTFADDTGLGTITNDDAAVLTINDVSVTEGDSGNVDMNFIVTLDQAVDVDVTVDFALQNTTTSTDDFAAGQTTTGQLTIPAGQQTATLLVQAAGDSTVELDETFSVVLSNLVAGATTRSVTLQDDTGLGTVTNDDAAILSITDVTQQEGSANGTTTFTFDLSLSNPVDVPVSVRADTADGTATVADNDYQAIVNSVAMFNAGATSGVAVTVLVNHDLKLETDEVFSLVLSELQATNRDVQLNGGGGQISANGTISNDDGLPSISITDVTDREPAAGSQDFVFEVTLSNPTAETVTVDFVTTAGTATASSDFTPQSGTLTFPPNTTGPQLIRVPVLADDEQEIRETFTVTLNNPANATIADGEGIGSIEDETPEASLSGFVFVDANNNGVRDSGEAGVPGVLVTLSGTSNAGDAVNQTARTDDQGAYSFTQLFSGTYQLDESQPAAFADGPESVGSQGGTAGPDQLSNLTLTPGQAGTENNFGERGLLPQFISKQFFVASRGPMPQMLRTVMARAEQMAGNAAEATAILNGLPAANVVVNDTTAAAAAAVQALTASNFTQASGEADAIVADPSLLDEVLAEADDSEIIVADEAEMGDDPLVPSNPADDNSADDNSADETTEDATPQEPLVAIRVQPVDLAGQPIEQIAVGEQFEVEVLVRDLRPNAQGVFAAYVDLLHQLEIASVQAAAAANLGFDIDFGPDFGNVQRGALTGGQLDEVGAVAGLTPLGGGEFLLFSTRYTANAPGQLQLQLDPADLQPNSDVLLYGLNDPVPTNRIEYGAAVLQVVADTEGEGESNKTSVDQALADEFWWR